MAFENATRAGKTIHVKCHADLNFLAVPIDAKEKKFVAIVGRAFLKSEDYRKATGRAIEGDWQQFSPEELFSNVLISSSLHDLEVVAGKYEKLTDEEKEALLHFDKTIVELPEEIESAVNSSPEENKEIVSASSADFSGELEGTESTEKTVEVVTAVAADDNRVDPQLESESASRELIEKNSGETAELSAWRSLFSSLLNLGYREACGAILKFLGKRYQLSDLAWLERREGVLEIVLACGTLKNQHVQFSIAANDKRLLETVKNETSLEFRERETGETANPQTIQLFPVAVGGQIHGALIAGDDIPDENVKRHIARFARGVASELEILRLREEIRQQSSMSKAIYKFNEGLRNMDAAGFWEFLAQTSAEIMQAERSSLLMFDESANEFAVKAAVGTNADIVRAVKENVGERIAHTVLQHGTPLVVRDIQTIDLPAAPQDWKYKTDSFISYPIIINNQKIGVLNVTDKIDGNAYDEYDLKLIDAFAPQLALAIDRTILKRKADEFEQLSMTDSLTGLPNRRYLRARLAEEIKRSQRHGFPMSLLAVDVDEFKSYNDSFTHPEGDKALRLVGEALKVTLRGADVAARYGGEEFSILLPQTTLGEAHTIAERIRERVENTQFPNRQVTVSIGIATCSPNLCTREALIFAADKALYEAKKAGRNNVKIFENTMMVDIKEQKDDTDDTEDDIEIRKVA
jgi:diguanylate cyclase (GGDEF)-like protein